MLVDICGSFKFRGGDSEAIELFIYMSCMRIETAHETKVVNYFGNGIVVQNNLCPQDAEGVSA